MKKNLIYSLTLIVAIGLMACNREEKNLFEQSAAERQQQVRQQIKDQLVGSDNGWEMLYFSTEEHTGYAFLMKFAKDGTVLVAAKNDVSCGSHLYKTETSLWDIDYTQADVLTFNTYNTLFHAFSDPSSDGLGYEGDYEFVIMKERNDQTIRLKGKKSNTNIHLNRLGSEVDWETYFSQIDHFDWITLCGNSQSEYIYQGGDSVVELTYQDGYFTYKDSMLHALGTITTPTGLHFYKTLPNSMNVDALDFVLNADSSRLICVQNNAINIAPKYFGLDYYKQLIKDKTRWTVTADLSSSDVQQSLKTIQEKAHNKGADIARYTFSQLVNKGDTAQILLVDYTVDGKLMQGYLVLDMQEVAENAFTYSLIEADASIMPLAKRIGLNEALGVKELTKVFCDTYKLQTYITNINQVQLLLVSQKTSGKQIHLTANKLAI
ncbi:MAG: DUF4302 domain-containing protein [Paludibacteraceae bacterium]|nr:DUF4302 domain-containing protein [Paludibacteraceae bacterium]